MREHRDQWGETAEERHARILARDLSWITYAEASARDGVPRSERDHLIFNDGYAAGRADYLMGRGEGAALSQNEALMEAAWSEFKKPEHTSDREALFSALRAAGMAQ